MTDKDKLKHIEKYLNELHLYDMTKEEFETEIMNMKLKDIINYGWRLYCFAGDICYLVNLEDE